VTALPELGHRDIPYLIKPCLTSHDDPIRTVLTIRGNPSHVRPFQSRWTIPNQTSLTTHTQPDRGDNPRLPRPDRQPIPSRARIRLSFPDHTSSSGRSQPSRANLVIKTFLAGPLLTTQTGCAWSDQVKNDIPIHSFPPFATENDIPLHASPSPNQSDRPTLSLPSPKRHSEPSAIRAMSFHSTIHFEPSRSRRSIPNRSEFEKKKK